MSGAWLGVDLTKNNHRKRYVFQNYWSSVFRLEFLNHFRFDNQRNRGRLVYAFYEIENFEFDNEVRTFE